MPDEKKEETIEEKPTEEKELVWKSIEELLEEVNKIHFIEATYRGKRIRFGLKELTDSEMVPPLSMETLQNKPPKEREMLLSEWLKKDIIRKVEKAGKIDSCTNSNVLTEELWDSLPKRIKNLIISGALDTRDGLVSDFLSV